MSYQGFEFIDPLSPPGTVDPSGSLAELNPLPPPGNPVDSTAKHLPLAWGIYPAQEHTFALTFGGTITEGQVWSLTFVPTRIVNGSVQSAALNAITISVTVNATATDEALALQFEQAIAAAFTLSTTTAIASTTRIGEILKSATAAGAVLTTVGRLAGSTYSISYTTEAGGTITGADTPTVDAEGTDMQIGVAITKTGVHADGVSPLVRPCQSGDTADSIVGFVAAANTAIKAIDPDTGYTAQYVRPGRRVAYIPLDSGHSQYAVTSDAACAADQRVWVRVVAGAGEIAGAVSDTPDEVVQTLTITPTPGNNEVASGYVEVFDRDGLSVGSFPYSFTTDADNTAAESVTELGADLTTPIASYAAGSGTDTYILVAVAGYTLRLVNTGAHVLTGVSTGGTNDHVRLPIKFSRTTTRAGVAAVQI